MRLTRAGEYGVRCILYLAAQGRGVLIPRKEIVEAMEIPDQFLVKIAQELAKAGFIEIVQGAKGGFRLLRPLEEIDLLGVVEAVIGEIFLNDCILNPDSCKRVNTCAVHRVWEKARNQLRDTLREATFSRLVAETTCMDPPVEETS